MWVKEKIFVLGSGWSGSDGDGGYDLKTFWIGMQFEVIFGLWGGVGERRGHIFEKWSVANELTFTPYS